MVTLAEIRAASARIHHMILRTPLMVDPTGSGLSLKAEHLQRTGSFKLRGASHRVTRAVQEEGARHVVTASSGNHGQAVAYVARALGIKATIVVPEDAAAVKVRGIVEYGAQVEFCGTTSNQRLARAAEITRTEGAIFIPPYDHPHIIAGQGTAGLEIVEQAPDVEAVFVPIGGGGLISGIAIAIKESNPRIKVFGVEPAIANDTQQSLREGRIITHAGTATIADGLRTSQPGDLTFPIMQRYLDDVVLVSETEIRSAGRYLLERMKQVVEPSGAVSVAAAMRHGVRAVAVTSGGNIDLKDLSGVPAWQVDSGAGH